MKSNNNLINFSRAGDIFHYRWAAKRCLKLLDFNTNLRKITIEGSLEPDKPGECVVDVAEYSDFKGNHGVEYFQLKHSTTQLDKPFTLSTLKDTIVGFSARFREFSLANSGVGHYYFTVITNRPIADSFKIAINKLANNQKTDSQFTITIKKYTGLEGKQLAQFCSLVKLCDGEGNYDAQKYDIHRELALLSASKELDKTARLLVSKITEKIEPGKNNVITINDVLEVFDVTDIGDFFPAPPLFEPISEYIQREQQEDIFESIRVSKSHILITANGGVGKSILCQNMGINFEPTSCVIAYDCFGNGGYRRTSQKRHRCQDAFVQVSNQLAKEGLCTALIPSRLEPDDYWMRSFLKRLEEACGTLKKRYKEALLVLIFDAVDNAEMAAQDSGDKCSASLLIREGVPENCRIIYSSRPERIYLFDPPSNINIIKLRAFSDCETLRNITDRYQNALLADAKEFNRLTSGNPRVQASALSLNYPSVSDLLASFCSNPQTVDDLIEKQLEKAIDSLKDSFPRGYRVHIDSICTSLATLPPFIPLSVLALAADVPVDSVRSFITELGRPLWMTDNSVQFRDEPTEKWFQDRYIATTEQIRNFIIRIKQLANNNSYISEALPLLMLKAELFDELVELALSEDLLPIGSPFDARKIRLFRLQYAFKAALRKGKYFEASKLALRAGEEIAGDERQIEMLSSNCDLAARFLSSERVQELAHRRVLNGDWEGSSTVYASSLLSSIDECVGEARSYLRSAQFWLKRYFECRDNAKNLDSTSHFDEKLHDTDILELAISNYQLFGELKSVDYILSWSPQSCVFKVSQMFIRRLIDWGHFDVVTRIAIYGKSNPSFVLAVTSELMNVGKCPPRECLTRCLNQIIKPSSRLKRPNEHTRSDYSLDVFLSFFEACTLKQLPAKNIVRGLNYYVTERTLSSVASEHQYMGCRDVFLRSISVKIALKQEFSATVDEILPKQWLSGIEENHTQDDLRKVKKSLNKLLSWYLVRAKILAGEEVDLLVEHQQAVLNSQGGSFDYDEQYSSIPYDKTVQRFKNISFYSKCELEINQFLSDFQQNKITLRTNDKLFILRVCSRNPVLEVLIDAIEVSCYDELQEFNADESPESYSEQYIALARAILPLSFQDAAVYFDQAIEIASNFGQEAVERWGAIVSIAERSSESQKNNSEAAHRFMRCAELIGETVAKEKYWDRNGALETCFMLSPKYAFSVVSRWKERGVGWHEKQIVTLANCVLHSGLVAPDIAWCLSAFSWEYGRTTFISECIDKVADRDKQKTIFDSLVRDLRVKDSRGKCWDKIAQVSENHNFSHSELSHIGLLRLPNNDNFRSKTNLVNEECKEEYNWQEVYGEFNILSSDGFSRAFEKCEGIKGYKERERFWTGCYSTLTSRTVGSFLGVVVSSEYLDFYDIRSCFKAFPEDWKLKPSVNKVWNHSIKCIAKRYPHQFTSSYGQANLLDDFDHTDSTQRSIRDGVLEGFSDSVDLESASALFSFANYSTSLITVLEAERLLDFGLKRFEKHIDDDFADGCWSKYFDGEKSVEESLAAFVYVNLGSPKNKERWKAVHAVRKLYELGHNNMIEYLIDFMVSVDIKEFTPPMYPFYEMHAKLYLLAALSISASSSGAILLKNRNKVFSDLTCDSSTNVLIQNYAKKIVEEIEKAFPGSFDDQELVSICKVGLSQLKPIEDVKRGHKTNSPWHLNGSIDTAKKFSFSHDFDRYWFEPLGRVFGISAKEVEELAVDVVINDWKMTFNGSYIDDPRSNLWRNSRNRETWHSHGEYPDTDTYGFYVSYHAMLSVASKLLLEMPILQDYDYIEDSWLDWLKHHLLFGERKYLIADMRDSFPLDHRLWVLEDKNDNWQWEISSSDFIELLYSEIHSNIWIDIAADWNEYNEGRNESISISSILIPKGLGDSFLKTITGFENHMHEVYLLDFCDDDMRPNPEGDKFRGQVWINRKEHVYGLDKQDPYAGDIESCLFAPEEMIVARFGLRACKFGKNWFLNDENQASIVNKLWSDDKPSDLDTYYRKGIRTKASLEFLVQVCKDLDVEIAIQVNIERTLVGRYNNKSNENYGHVPQYSKTFLLSGDGRLRDTRRCYSFRKETVIEP
jgi:hypothetical protein